MNKFIFGIAGAALLFVCGFVWLIGAENPVTPAGYVGYITQGAVFGKTEFYGLQMGPSSPGRTWLLDVTNVSVTPYTYTEAFKGDTAVLAKDNLAISFNVHLVWKVRSDKVQEVVEKYSTLSVADGNRADAIVQVAYDNFVKEPLRTFARDAVQQYNGLDLKNAIGPIGAALLVQVRALTEKTPFEVGSVVVGNIQYPDEVTNAVSTKLAATQTLERKQIEIEIEKAEAEKRVVQAQGIAKAMEVIQVKLTPLYVQHEAIEAQKLMVNSPNHTTVYIPAGPMGVPLVRTVE